MVVSALLDTNAPLRSPLWRRARERDEHWRRTKFDPLDAEYRSALAHAPPIGAQGWLRQPEHQCSRIELTTRRDDRTWRKALPCRTWACAYCARKLRHGIMALAASGTPNRMLTLTCAPSTEPDPTLARALLHRSWRALRLTIARELVKPTTVRWRVSGRPQGRSRGPASTPKAEAVKSAAPPALPYFAVIERHKSGRPHLHILLRCGYIPQKWLSFQMNRLARSPIVDIRKVSGTKQAAAYAAKYIGKAPARFGKTRGYWYTRNWAPRGPEPEAGQDAQKVWFSAHPRRWSETIDEVEHICPIIDVTSDGWFSLIPNAARWHPLLVKERFPPVWKPPPKPKVL